MAGKLKEGIAQVAKSVKRGVVKAAVAVSASKGGFSKLNGDSSPAQSKDAFLFENRFANAETEIRKAYHLGQNYGTI